MLVSVTERTREIGVRRALGATRKNILQQLLVASVVLSLVGVLTGETLGAGSAILFRITVHWTTAVSGSSIVVAWVFAALVGVGFGVVFGVVFGVWPAIPAYSLNPIESPRYEWVVSGCLQLVDCLRAGPIRNPEPTVRCVGVSNSEASTKSMPRDELNHSVAIRRSSSSNEVRIAVCIHHY